jgi:hypothetical protein
VEQEQRVEERVDVNVRFFVNVHESALEPEMMGQSLECEAIDFSAHGMQFSTNRELSSGALLNITIGVGEPFAMYALRGEVRWVRSKDNVYYMGVLLKHAEDMDLEKWVGNFGEQISGDAQ